MQGIPSKENLTRENAWLEGAGIAQNSRYASKARFRPHPFSKVLILLYYLTSSSPTSLRSRASKAATPKPLGEGGRWVRELRLGKPFGVALTASQ
jgi:hypothetical protein